MNGEKSYVLLNDHILPILKTFAFNTAPSDQATEATIDLALLLKIPFAVVPCCVFPSEFPNRTLNGKRVRTHAEFIDYLCMKHDNIRKCTLPFIETDTAKNVVLYMLQEDFTT